jgi:hypothetical protein
MQHQSTSVLVFTNHITIARKYLWSYYAQIGATQSFRSIPCDELVGGRATLGFANYSTTLMLGINDFCKLAKSVKNSTITVRPFHLFAQNNLPDQRPKELREFVRLRKNRSNVHPWVTQTPPCRKIKRYFDFSNLYSTRAVFFCRTIQESCSITFSIDIAPSLHKNYVVVVLYARVREESFLKRKICYYYQIIVAKPLSLLIFLDDLI